LAEKLAVQDQTEKSNLLTSSAAWHADVAHQDCPSHSDILHYDHSYEGILICPLEVMAQVYID